MAADVTSPKPTSANSQGKSFPAGPSIEREGWRRRDFLTLSGAAGLGLLIDPRKLVAADTVPSVATPPHPTASPSPEAPPIWIILHLAGGNDGLNTLVPLNNPLYAQARPSLSIPRDGVVPINEQWGLNRRLEALVPAFQAGEVAIVQGVGYPGPDRSHFRSADIWNAARPKGDRLDLGFLELLREPLRNRFPGGVALDGLNMTNGDKGPFAGHLGLVAAVRDLGAWGGAEDAAPPIPPSDAGNPALAAVLRGREQVAALAKLLREALARAPDFDKQGVAFPNTTLGRRLRGIAQLVTAGLNVPVIHLQQGGYDTHAKQEPTHGELLGHLGTALAAFRQALLVAGGVGLWRRVTVMAWSEFGRRLAENGSAGTDHGVAGPVFLMGGRIQGGIHGEAPSLKDLDLGDLRHHVDFRAIYAEVVREVWGLPWPADLGGAAMRLPGLFKSG